MHIDAFSILLFSLLVKVLLGVLFFVFWFRSRRANWFAWWSAAFLLGSLATAVLMIRGFGDQISAVGVGVGSLVASFACCWQGARVFERRAPLWFPVFAAPVLWLALCLFPPFVQFTAYRVAGSSCLLAPLMAMAAFEFWRGRDERLPSRWTIIALFASIASIFAARIPLIPVAPFPFGALPMQVPWVAIFNLLIFLHTILLAVLLVAISKERLEFEQRTKAQTDPLTGALNRRAFMVRGRRLVLRHKKSGEPLCLLFIDLDRFKALNDRYGHSGGDDVLMKFVTIVHDNIRPTDFLFRVGGEEFCCLLPHTETEQALRVAERIRRQLEESTVDIAGMAVKVTVSLGIASTEAFGYEVETLVRRADMAVYAAKRQGRNKVVVANDGEAIEGAHGSLADGGTAAAS
ncbi:MAG: GGDEF domain-containing protein [Pseudolabrys sp.]|jgi:diguanylate cyclase (GGDEF)-like protein